MHVPAHFDRRALLLWILAAVIGGLLALWDLSSHRRAHPDHATPATRSPTQDIEIIGPDGGR